MKWTGTLENTLAVSYKVRGILISGVSATAAYIILLSLAFLKQVIRHPFMNKNAS